MIFLEKTVKQLFHYYQYIAFTRGSRTRKNILFPRPWAMLVGAVACDTAEIEKDKHARLELNQIREKR